MYGLATFLNDLSKKSTDKQEGQNKFQRNFKKFLKKEKKKLIIGYTRMKTKHNQTKDNKIVTYIPR